MGIARRLPGDRAQPEAQGHVRGRAADAAIVQADLLAFAVFQKHLAVIAVAQRPLDDRHGRGLVQCRVGPLEEKLVGGGERGHGLVSGRLLSAKRMGRRVRFDYRRSCKDADLYATRLAGSRISAVVPSPGALRSVRRPPCPVTSARAM